MHRTSKLLVLAAAILLAPVPHAAAQQEEPLIPRPIDAKAPTAQRARAVADLVLAGDREKLESYLKENAAPEYVSAPTFASDVTAVLDAMKAGARTVARLDGLGSAGVGVALAQKIGAPLERAIVVRLEPAEPHRVTGLRVVPIGGGPGQ
jgi:hypothetical protein